ncbi:MAG: RNA-binding domain-containing protein [Bacteroidota bacterium]
MDLPVNIEDLLHSRKIESDRIEFKEGWNPDRIYRSICAFANDFENTGGGYILIGIKEENKLAKRPVSGLSLEEIANIQEKMIGFNNLIRPVYHPRLYVIPVDGTHIIVLWVPAGASRPYEVPDDVTKGKQNYNYRIRKYSSSVVPSVHEKPELIGLASQLPFDDKPNILAALDDISFVLLKDYLRVTRSRLAELAESRSKAELLEQMELLSGPPENSFIRNVALMLFCETPEKFFPYTWIDLVHFPKGPAAKQFTEKSFKGPVHLQIKHALDYIKSSFLTEQVNKIPGQAEALRYWNYPYEALEEVLANCIYHRNYQEHEPVQIRIEPGCIYIYNLGGPDRTIRLEDFTSGNIRPKRYRNRRLGDFLKELDLTEGKATGVPVILKTMKDNGSPVPVFAFDDERTWFEVKLPVHPAFHKRELPSELKAPKTLDDLKALLDWILSDPNISNAIPDANDVDSDQVITEGIDKIKDSVKVNDGINDLITNAIQLITHDNVEVSTRVNDIVSDHVGDEDKNKVLLTLEFCNNPQSSTEILGHLNLTKHTDNFVRYIKPMLKNSWIGMTLPDKLTSRNQRYYTTLKGAILLKLLQISKKTGK